MIVKKPRTFVPNARYFNNYAFIIDSSPEFHGTTFFLRWHNEKSTLA